MPIPSVARAHLAQLLPVLKPIAVRPVPPRTPWNFRATANSSGNALSWESVPGADGYELQMTTNGDFSTASTVFAGAATTFTDAVASGTKRWYRVRPFARTRQDEIVPGTWSAPLISTSGSGTTTYDQTTHTAAWQSGRRPPSAISSRVTVKARS